MSPSESFSLEITRPLFFSYIYILYVLYFASSIAPYKDRRRSSKDFPALPRSLPLPPLPFPSRKRESAATMGLHGLGERGGWSAGKPEDQTNAKEGDEKKKEMEGGGKRRTVLLNWRAHQRGGHRSDLQRHFRDCRSLCSSRRAFILRLSLGFAVPRSRFRWRGHFPAIVCFSLRIPRDIFPNPRRCDAGRSISRRRWHTGSIKYTFESGIWQESSMYQILSWTRKLIFV